MGNAGGDDIILGLVLLQHEPHGFHVVPGMSPVPLGFEIAQVEDFFLSEGDGSHGTGYFAGQEGFSSKRGLVVEENPIACKHPIGLAVVDRGPEGIELGHAIGRTGIEGRLFGLGDFLHLAEKLRG